MMRRLGDAQPRRHRLDHRLAVIDQHMGIDIHLDLAVRAVELPLPLAGRWDRRS